MIEKLKLLIEKNRFLADIVRYIYRKTILRYRHYKQNKLFKENAKEILMQLNKAFKELNIPYWLVYGTLLGVYRDGKFIDHDLDIDLGLFLDDYNEEIAEVLSKYGFKLKKQFLIDNGEYGREETYFYKGIGIDLFYFIKKENCFKVHDFKNEDGKSWAKTIQDNGGLIVRERTFEKFDITYIDFLDSKYPIPNNTHKHLASVYGEDFMIPNPSWSPYNKPKNIEVLDNKIGVVKTYE